MRARTALLPLVLVLCSCLPTEDEDKAKDDSAPVPVEVTRSVRGDISTSILSTTTIDSEVKVDVYPKHTGPIVKVQAEEGDWVEPGQLLAQIDPAEHELAYKQASATFAELKTGLARLETMHKSRMASQEAFDAARFAHEKAKISMEMAKLQLDNTRILSPIKGMILLRGVRFGERVTLASLAYSIMDMEARIAEVHLPESEIARIRPELLVELSTDSRPDRVFPGKVRKISPAVDPRSGTVKVTIDFQDPELLLKPGMFVRASIVVDTHKGVVLVPRSAVLNLENRVAVYVVRPAPAPAATPAASPAPEKPAGGAIAAERPVTTQGPKKPEAYEVVERVFFEPGFQNERFVEAVSGIQPDDRLVHVGQQGLQSGAHVLDVTASPGGPAAPPAATPQPPASAQP